MFSEFSLPSPLLLQAAKENINVKTISGTVLMGDNKLNSVNLEVYTGKINSNKNVINKLIINQKIGELND